MKVSEVIERLRAAMGTCGDVEVIYTNWSYDEDDEYYEELTIDRFLIDDMWDRVDGQLTKVPAISIQFKTREISR